MTTEPTEHTSSRSTLADIIIKPLGHGWRGSHQHVIIDESGNVLMNEWREK